MDIRVVHEGRKGDEDKAGTGRQVLEGRLVRVTKTWHRQRTWTGMTDISRKVCEDGRGTRTGSGL